jgi:F0F1-type ATP synthase assembly protein I
LDRSLDKLDGSSDKTALSQPRQTWKGFDDAFARGIELVATPLLFGLGGWYLDRWAGTRPLFTLILFVVAVVGMAARMYYAYTAAMEEHDRAGVWARTSRPASAAGSGDTASAAGSGTSGDRQV